MGEIIYVKLSNFDIYIYEYIMLLPTADCTHDDLPKNSDGLSQSFFSQDCCGTPFLSY